MFRKIFFSERFGLILSLVSLFALTGCAAMVQGNADSNLDNFNPEFSKALPTMGFPSAVERGLLGRGIHIVVIDLFSGSEAHGTHGWAVLETIEQAAPEADVTRLDLLKVDSENPLDAFIVAQTLARFLN
jgi:hypothetical protein